ncbi:MAG: hypothetical protein WC375_13350 [Methanomassiliicoccales archaeon]|jgi:hypothetical protein
MNLETIKKLSPLEKKSKLLKVCGWWKLDTPKGKRWVHPYHKKRKDGILYEDDCFPIPDYLNDLNAVSKVESRFTDTSEPSLHEYVENLVNVCSDDFRGEKAVIASAEQRVNAILLTLEIE